MSAGRGPQTPGPGRRVARPAAEGSCDTRPVSIATPPSEQGGPQDLFVRLGVPLPGLELLVRTGVGVPVWSYPVAAGEGFDHWIRLRRLHDRTGLYPFLTGAQDEIDDMVYMAENDCDPTAVERGLALDAVRRLDDLAGQHEAPSPGDVFAEPDLEAQPNPEPRFDSDENETLVALIPARAGYEVPGLLSWQGATNVELDGADHVAVLRRWHELFGAQLVTLGFDTLELLVPRPPLDPWDAAVTAVDQYAYCPDAVDQGVGSVAALAAGQVRSPSWHFWWD